MEENGSAMYCSLRAEKVLKSLPELETSIVQDGPFQHFFFFFSGNCKTREEFSDFISLIQQWKW